MDMNIIFMATSIILSLIALILLYRVWKGPTMIDRLIAADSIDIIVGVIMIVFGCLEGRGLFLDLGLIVTLLGFIGSVLICKYLEGAL